MPAPRTIKSAFRKLAKKLHPDANKNDPRRPRRFAELNAAYEIVGDDDKRKAFDRGEIDAEGKPRFQGFRGGGGRPEPGAAVGRRPRGRVRDLHLRSGRLPAQRAAAAAAGGGGGGGFEDILKDMFGGGRARRRRGGFQFEQEDIAPAAGRDVTGTARPSRLPEAATGATRRVHLPTGKEVEVKIPAGLADGQQIRLKGQGLAGPRRARRATLLITVTIAPHPLFQRDGTDLRLELPVTLYEAVLGGKVRVPTLDGAVELAIPAGHQFGPHLPAQGQGLSRQGRHRRSLIATVRIVLPEGGDAELEELMQKWRDSKPYDPRRDHELTRLRVTSAASTFALVELVVGGLHHGLQTLSVSFGPLTT